MPHLNIIFPTDSYTLEQKKGDWKQSCVHTVTESIHCNMQYTLHSLTQSNNVNKGTNFMFFFFVKFGQKPLWSSWFKYDSQRRAKCFDPAKPVSYKHKHEDVWLFLMSQLAETVYATFWCFFPNWKPTLQTQRKDKTEKK